MNTDSTGTSKNADIIQKPMPQGRPSKLQEECISVISAIAKPQKVAYANGDIANGFSVASNWTMSFARAKGNEILSPDQSPTKEKYFALSLPRMPRRVAARAGCPLNFGVSCGATANIL